MELTAQGTGTPTVGLGRTLQRCTGHTGNQNWIYWERYKVILGTMPSYTGNYTWLYSELCLIRLGTMTNGQSMGSKQLNCPTTQLLYIMM